MTTRSLRLLALVACLLSCDRANPVAPGGTVLTLTANPSKIGLDGASTLTVTGIRPDGNPLFAGTRINLATNLGTLTPSVIEIGENGSGTATLRPDGRTGNAEVTAAAPTTDAMVTVTVQIGETADTRPTVSLTATPDTIGIGGTALIVAVVRRADGSAFGSGAVVRFRTSLGTIDAEATTDSSSEARVTLRAGDQPGTATVTAATGSSDEKTVAVTIENRKPSLILNANPSSIPVLGTSQITIIARDDNQNPLGAGHRIRLTADLGSVADSVTTDSNGEAETTFTAGSKAGNGRVTAILDNSDAEDVTIIIRDAPAFIDLRATPQTIDDTGGAVQLTATVTNAEGDPVASALVTFNADIGGVFSAGTAVTTNQQGQATNTLTVAETDIAAGRQSFTITATVTSEGVSLSAVATIQIR